MHQNRNVAIRIIGIGNLLLGDEGVGVHVVRHLLEHCHLPESVDCLDGGTGSLVLLEPLQTADHIILVDATMDGAPPGTLRRLVPKFSSDFPPASPPMTSACGISWIVSTCWVIPLPM